MSFSSQWLALREPLDHMARNPDILARLAEYFSGHETLNITDFGSGTGSSMRALKPFLQQKTCWHLIDNDKDLLELAKQQAGDTPVELTLADLSTNLDPLFQNTPDIVTTSAFLDLVSHDWLRKLAAEFSRTKTPFYASLTYDGRAGCQPELDGDQTVLEEFNKHQKTDKGFGPALGPTAADVAIRIFKSAGFDVIFGDSDWQANPQDGEFQKLLLDGWVSAACEIRPDRIHTFKEWLARRYQLIDEENSSLFVGHVDFLALPE